MKLRSNAERKFLCSAVEALEGLLANWPTTEALAHYTANTAAPVLMKDEALKRAGEIIEKFRATETAIPDGTGRRPAQLQEWRSVVDSKYESVEDFCYEESTPEMLQAASTVLALYHQGEDDSADFTPAILAAMIEVAPSDFFALLTKEFPALGNHSPLGEDSEQ